MHQAFSSTQLHIVANQGTQHTEVIEGVASENVDVVVQENASLFLVVRLNGAEPMHHHIDVTVESGAQCTVLTINTASSPSIDIVQRGTIADGGSVRWQNITLAAATVTHDLVSRITGANGESAVDWMFYAKGTEQQTLNVRNIFDGRDGRGEILMRGVAEEKGHAIAKGMIEIGLGGGGTNTYLTQEVLMLDSSAKVDAVPGLEIKTNDVKASHSATVTRLTPEDLFYFASRGVPKKEARAMYIQGFLGAITERITDEKVREEILVLIKEKYTLA